MFTALGQRVAVTAKSWFTHGVPMPPKQLQSGPLNWTSYVPDQEFAPVYAPVRW